MEQKLLLEVPKTPKEEKNEPKLILINDIEVLKRNIKKWNNFMDYYYIYP